jgi:hypothetical protein
VSIKSNNKGVREKNNMKETTTIKKKINNTKTNKNTNPKALPLLIVLSVHVPCLWFWPILRQN